MVFKHPIQQKEGTMGAAPKTVKTSVNLPEESIEALREIASKTGSSMSDVIRQAISTEKFLRNEAEQGNRILIQDKDKNVKEIIIRR